MALFIVLGFQYRLSATLFFLGFSFIFLLDRARYLNHFYLICLYSFVMIFIPAHRSFSVDALRKPNLRSSTAPAWALWILRFHVGVVYFYGGLAKIDADWLRGDTLRIWLGHRTDYPLVGQYFTSDWLVLCFAYSGLMIDLFIVPF